MSDVPRFLLDQGFLASLASVDSSYSERGVNGRLALFIDYRDGRPISVQLFRMPAATSFKVHLAMETTANHESRGLNLGVALTERLQCKG